MSYCRFSCDNCQCDLYIYASVYGGWTTHVAVCRPVIPKDFPPPPKYTNKETYSQIWLDHHNALGKVLKDCEYTSLPGEFAGETLQAETIEELLEQVLMLKEKGYQCPAYVIETIKEEIADENKKGRTET